MKPVVYGRTLAIMASGKPMSKFDIAKAVPCHHQTARRILIRIHKEKKIHIADWTYNYQQPIPVYVMGEGEDKPRPAPVTPLEATRRYRAKPVKREREAKQKRVKRFVQAVIKSDPQDQIFNLIVRRVA